MTINEMKKLAGIYKTRINSLNREEAQDQVRSDVEEEEALDRYKLRNELIAMYATKRSILLEIVDSNTPVLENRFNG